MACVPLVPARFTFAEDGTPRSLDYDDVYHASGGGPAQCRHVFLAGNGLPDRWSSRGSFTIFETGFGCGLNFLTTWATWRDDPLRCARLHFVAVEKHPFRREDLRSIHRAWPEFAALSRRMLEYWPPLVPGFHRLNLESGRVTLTLLFGDALALLTQLRACADAFFLDGFAPAKNPDPWSPAVFRQIGRLAAEGATAATWSVATVVRDGLRSAGFAFERQPGFAGKREMLIARLERRRPSQSRLSISPPAHRHAVVIGAGLAGSAVACGLTLRGWEVEVLERHPLPAQEASGNLAGVLRPLLSVDDNRLARLARAGFLHALRQLRQLGDDGHPARWQACGVLQLARVSRHEATQRETVSRHAYPADYASFVEREVASALVGYAAAAGGWHFPAGGWVNPPSLVSASLARGGERSRLLARSEADSLLRHGDLWRVVTVDGVVIAEAPWVILATGCATPRIEGALPLPLRRARGQVSLLPAVDGRALNCVVTQRGYATPAVDRWHCAGASFDFDDHSMTLKEADHAANLARLEAMLPGFTGQSEARTLSGRVGFRPTSPDKRPLVGALPCRWSPAQPVPTRLQALDRLPGILVANGFGARGLAWSALAAELICAEVEAEPLPLEAELIEALDPGRFMLRQARRAASALPGIEDYREPRSDEEA